MKEGEKARKREEVEEAERKRGEGERGGGREGGGKGRRRAGG